MPEASSAAPVAVTLIFDPASSSTKHGGSEPGHVGASAKTKCSLPPGGSTRSSRPSTASTLPRLTYGATAWAWAAPSSARAVTQRMMSASWW